MLELFYHKGVIEAGCDEAGRGCLAGPVYAAAVILPPDFHNDLLNDSHALPFTMKMDFDAIVTALKDINYQGYFTMEADQHMGAYTKENAFEGVKALADTARKLARMFEAE